MITLTIRCWRWLSQVCGLTRQSAADLHAPSEGPLQRGCVDSSTPERDAHSAPVSKGSDCANTAPPAPDDATIRQRARQLARAIDRALALGLLEHADRLVMSAIRLADHNRGLTERIARLRIAQGRCDEALMLIESVAEPTDSMRLLRAVCLILAGRRIEAEMDLEQWSRHQAMPLAARQVLAMLYVESHRYEEAIASLRCAVQEIEDPESLKLIICTLLASDREDPIIRDEVKSFVRRLEETAVTESQQHYVRQFLASLGITGSDPQTALPAAEQVRLLAAELSACEASIEPLVLAQSIEPHLPTARLIHAALRRCLPELSDRSAAVTALATLSSVIESREVAQLQSGRADFTTAPPSRSDPAADRTGQHAHASSAKSSVIASIGPDTSPEHLDSPEENAG